MIIRIEKDESGEACLSMQVENDGEFQPFEYVRFIDSLLAGSQDIQFQNEAAVDERIVDEVEKMLDEIIGKATSAREKLSTLEQ